MLVPLSCLLLPEFTDLKRAKNRGDRDSERVKGHELAMLAVELFLDTDL